MAPTLLDAMSALNRGGRLVTLLAGVSALGLLARLLAARTVGFGDSEALYACYSLFPQPSYLDHPGLVGVLMRLLGGAAPPSPSAVHLATAFAATLAPWTVYLAARMAGGPRGRSLAGALAVAVVPEVAVGLFAMTPDLPLFFGWTLALATFVRGLRERPGTTAAAACFAASGLAVGAACVSKVSAVALAAAFLVTLAGRGARGHAKTLWPWVGVALGGVIVAPVLLFDARHGWPMLHHRLVDTQTAAGLSLRNLAAVVFGQAAYVSPLLAYAGLVLGRDLVRDRRRDVVHVCLASATFVPLALLGLLSLWSRVAEPHWLAPAWLALPIYFAVRSPDRPSPGRRLCAWGVAVGLASSTGVYAWVLVPSLVRLVPAASYDPRFDLANELFGWPEVATDVERTVDEVRPQLAGPEEVVVVGATWTVCAQLRAALPLSVPVGCAGPDPADFARWAPASKWSRAELVVLVHDNRAPADAAALFPDRTLLSQHELETRRGDRLGRRFTIEVLARRAIASSPPSAQPPPPTG